ncbi:MAG: recombination regulator RecX [Geobacteraceae bacterium]|nr:recombination regulator RecX [Geobacteraceae bacterium]
MEEAEKALACAVRALARRDHSVAELEAKLRDKGFSTGPVAEVVGRLARSGYLDDRRFAERWVESAVRSGRGYGPRLRLELARRGVAREIIADVVAAITATHGEGETLAMVAARKFAGFDPHTASDRDKRRLFAYLQRRGFSSAAIFDFLRKGAAEPDE